MKNNFNNRVYGGGGVRLTAPKQSFPSFRAYAVSAESILVKRFFSLCTHFYEVINPPHPSFRHLLPPTGRRKKSAFTLAEVLITLGIIGIVAAMTMPSLIASYKKKEYSAQLKKFYSLMSQAITLSEVKNGEIENWTRVGNLKDENPDNAITKNYEEMKRYWDYYYGPYIKTIKEEKSTEGGGLLKVYLIDGSSMSIWNGGCMSFEYDVNGNKRPNKAGADIFHFHVCESKYERKLYLGNNIVFGPNGMIDATSREKAIDLCKTGNCASLLIMYDNFEFKDDYPIGF